MRRRPAHRVASIALAVAAAFVVASPADAGRVRTRDGATHEGVVRLAAAGRVMVAPATGGPVVTLDLDAVESATFDAASAVPAAAPPMPASQPTTSPTTDASTAPATSPATNPSTPPTTAPAAAAAHAAAAPAVPAPWVSEDVGYAESPGGAAFDGPDRVALLNGGRGFPNVVSKEKSKRGDSFHFLHRTLAGDGAVVARVRVTDERTLTRVGAMMRRGTGAEAVHVLVARGPSLHVYLSARTADGEAVQEIAESERAVLGAVWVKVERQGYAFVGSESVDGREWREVGRVTLPVAPDEPVEAGIAAAGGVLRKYKESYGRALVDRLQVVAAGAGATASRTPRGVVTRTGSLIAGEVTSADADRVTLARDGAELAVATADVARIILTPLVPAQEEKLAGGSAPGALLLNGDFFDGEFRSLGGGRLKLTSLLFGPRDVDAGREAAAVVLRDVKPEDAVTAITVRLRDGSRVLAKAVTPMGDEAYGVDEPAAGMIRVAPGDVVEISRAGRR